MNGTFVAVVGPSGSGKDSILECACAALDTRDDIVFARRRITRPAGAGEDHSPVSEAEFGAAQSRGEFALFTNVRVVRVTVSEEVRLARILARGREDAAAAAARIVRRDPAPDFAVDLEIVNDGTLDEASGAFAAFLGQVRNSVRTPDGR